MTPRGEQGNPSRTHRRLRVGRLAGVLVVLAGLAGGGWLRMEYRAFVENPVNLPNGRTYYTIPSGASPRWIAQDLAQRGVLPHPSHLVWYARWSGKGPNIKAGEYELVPGTTAPQLLDQFVAGKVVQHSLMLVEGWTFPQVLDAIDRYEALDHRLTGLPDGEIMARIGHPGEHPEGRFLPDTYRFPRGTTDIAFLQRAYIAMQRYLEKEWDGRADGLPFASPYEALILASIVEKETAVPAERFEIAGVFVRRLRLGMRLQTDPTVIYGMGAGFDGNLRRQDLVRDTPYNTYARSGLPPTPIAMPGAASIHAVLHPADGTALYFVARGDGSHHFSSTLEEHNGAVAKYQLRKPPGRPTRSPGEGDTAGAVSSSATPSSPNSADSPLP